MDTPEFEAACNEEIDWIPASQVTPEHLAELDRWAEIGWILCECGCLRRGKSGGVTDATN